MQESRKTKGKPHIKLYPDGIGLLHIRFYWQKTIRLKLPQPGTLFWKPTLKMQAMWSLLRTRIIRFFILSWRLYPIEIIEFWHEKKNEISILKHIRNARTAKANIYCAPCVFIGNISKKWTNSFPRDSAQHCNDKMSSKRQRMCDGRKCTKNLKIISF